MYFVKMTRIKCDLIVLKLRFFETLSNVLTYLENIICHCHSAFLLSLLTATPWGHSADIWGQCNGNMSDDLANSQDKGIIKLIST